MTGEHRVTSSIEAWAMFGQGTARTGHGPVVPVAAVSLLVLDPQHPAA